MIISKGRNYIFVHIPKTGGTALALALEDRVMADDILIGDTPKAKKRKNRLKGVQTAGRLWKHSTLADVEGLVDRSFYDEALIFTLVRNPWDRMVSYYHWLRVQSFDHPAVGLAKLLTFSQFLNDPSIMRTIETHHYGSYMRDGQGVERAARFIRLEHLTEDLAPIEAHLGFKLTVPRANESIRDRDWRGYYTPQYAALVGRICAEDVARFSYSFD